MTLLGPSGCGKTTTLRCVAGLEKSSSGSISIGDQVVAEPDANVFVPPHRRDLGMVFQSYAIWPHMNVFENVAYALEGRRLGKAEIARRTTAGARHRQDGASRRPAGAAPVGRPAATRRDRARAGRASRRRFCSTSR